MDNIFMNSKNSKISDPHRLLLNLTDKEVIYSRLFWVCIKEHGDKTVNPSIRIYINKIVNIITFEIKTSQTFNAWDNEITWKY